MFSKFFFQSWPTMLAGPIRVALIFVQRCRLAGGDRRRGFVRLTRRPIECHHPVVRVLYGVQVYCMMRYLKELLFFATSLFC
jgi:hypothetical protein